MAGFGNAQHTMTTIRSTVCLALLSVLGIAPACAPRSAPDALPLPHNTGAGGNGTTPDRLIVAGDLLLISVFGAPDLSRGIRVSAAGDVVLPLVGVTRAAGGTTRQLELDLIAKLRTYMRDPSVIVEVTEAAARPVYVLGAVNQPGAFTPTGSQDLTVLRAISVARGLNPSAAGSRAVVIRTSSSGERHQFPIDVNAVLRGAATDISLEPNDVVYVPKSTERVIALGVVDGLLRLVTFRGVF
jgi:protein involved in polysaccharide export with SLBB domain